VYGDEPSARLTYSLKSQRTSSDCGGAFSCSLLALLLGRLVEESQQRSRVDVASVVATLERKQVLAVVLLQCEPSATRRTDVQCTAHISPFLVLCHLHSQITTETTDASDLFMPICMTDIFQFFDLLILFFCRYRIVYKKATKISKTDSNS